MPIIRLLVFALLALMVLWAAAIAEVPPMESAELEAHATHIVDGKLARIYSSIEKSAEWETTCSVGEVQVSKVSKGEHAGKLAYVRFWHRKYIGKGEAPDGSYGHREIPKVGSRVRVYAREGDDGGLDVVLPNGIALVAVPDDRPKK